MKIRLFTFALMFAACCQFAHAQKPEDAGEVDVEGMKGSFQIEKGKVAKVYAVEKDGAEFRAYVVSWNGSEIVVSDMPGMKGKAYQVGDTLTFMVNRIDLKQAGSKPSLMFQLMPDFKHPEKTVDFVPAKTPDRDKAAK